jgi:hypothetical protein
LLIDASLIAGVPSSRGSQQIKIEINNRSRELRSSFPSGLTGQQRTVSFSDLEGNLSRHPVAFNRYCRNVASAALRISLLLQAPAGSEQKWAVGTAPVATWLRVRDWGSVGSWRDPGSAADRCWRMHRRPAPVAIHCL